MLADYLKVETHLSPRVAEYITYTFRSFLLNVHKQDKAKTTLYMYPATPWDYIKENFAPAWFLLRFPVEYVSKEVETTVEKNCPHIAGLPKDDRHIFWLYDPENKNKSWREYDRYLEDNP